MTDRNQDIDQMLHAAMGLGATASASALRDVSRLIHEDNTSLALDQIAILSSLTERAQTCLSVATQAEAEGDDKLAELGWLQALSLMNHLTEQTTGIETTVTEEEQFFAKQVAGKAH
ncbi:MAG: hypothetical protein ACR2OM_15980 [Aestuariivirgaceae bacterium]